MPAFNFKPEFAEAVERGEKRQTIRAERRDFRLPCKPGDRLMLYTGMRTPACRKLAEAICTSTSTVQLDADHLIINGMIAGDGKREKVARADGFETFQAMRDWFEQTHGLPFDGWLIKWSRSPRRRTSGEEK